MEHMTRKICRRSLLVCWSVVLFFSLYGFSCDDKKTDPGPNGNFDISLSGSVTKHFHGKNAQFQIEQNMAVDGHPNQVTVILVDDDGFRMTPFHFEKQLKTGSYTMDGNPQTGALFGSKDHPTQYFTTTGPLTFSAFAPDHVKGSLTYTFANVARTETFTAEGTFDAFPLQN